MNVAQTRSRFPWQTVLLMGGAGISHFAKPDLYDPMVPRWLPGRPRAWTYASGAVELACAALLCAPRTRRAGAWLTVAVLVGVYPANIQAALDGGIPGAKPPFDSAVAAWVRLPMQVPMIREAIKVARTA
ncbi:MAG: hypothetical protein FJW88_02850 [Actinobacteria bacterium]|nr:hypothetical protein [Actinomycetota bacterium]